ncbi:MAG: DUF6152 family protein [Bryobacteraceae bacterium]
MVRVSAVLGVLLAAPAFAHHSIRATYDRKQPVTITGPVANFEYQNPHSYVEVDAKDESGRIVRWTIEIAAVAVLAGRGWTRDTLKPGDVVTVSGYRAKLETDRAVAARFVLADGRELLSWPSGTMWPNPTEAEFRSGK